MDPAWIHNRDEPEQIGIDPRTIMLETGGTRYEHTRPESTRLESETPKATQRRLGPNIGPYDKVVRLDNYAQCPAYARPSHDVEPEPLSEDNVRRVKPEKMPREAGIAFLGADTYNPRNGDRMNDGMLRGRGEGAFVQQDPRVRHPRQAGHEGHFPCAGTFHNCSEVFHRQTDLNQHLRWHAKVKPHRCHFSYCPKTYVKRTDRDRHYRAHPEIDQRPRHPCPECDKKYVRTDTLDDHIRKHHRVQVPRPTSTVISYPAPR